MKISKTTKWILTLGILAILLAAAAILYAGQQTEHNQLSSDLDTAQEHLITNSQQRDQLESRLLEATLALSERRAQFTASDQSMDLEEALFGAADEAGVEITTLGCPPPKTEKQGKTTYEVFLASVGVEGGMEALFRFVGVLGYWLPSSSVESVSLGVLEDGEATLSLTLKVYTLQAE